MKKALLVIDVDHGDEWDSQALHSDAEKHQVALAIKKLLDEEREKDHIIVFIILVKSSNTPISGQEAQYFQGNIDTPDHSKLLNLELKPEGCLACDISDKWKLAEFLRHRHSDKLEPVFIKNEYDAFKNKKLENYLRENGVTEIELVGCKTDCCLKETATGALKAGFRVTLLAKASYHLTIKNEADASWWAEDVKRLAGLSNKDASISVAI